MRILFFAFALGLLIPSIFCKVKEVSSSQGPSGSGSPSTVPLSEGHSSINSTHLPFTSTRAHTSKTHPHLLPTGTNNVVPHPPTEGHPHHSESPSQRPSMHQTPAMTALEVIGGIIGFLFLLGLLRCFINYQRTPRRDRIAAIINRHRLQREMEELEDQQYNPFFRRSSLNGPPPPPYLPRPPAYHHRDQSSSTPLNSSFDLNSDSPPSPLPLQQNRSRATTPVQLPNR